MCGLVGFFGHWTEKREKMFRDLLRLSALRGPHSTGVGFAGVNGACSVIKAPVLPDVLLAGKEYKKVTSKGWYNCYMGHNRWATTGKINEANAHPFMFKSVMGCHNGTLHSRFDLDAGHLHETDSETIFFTINKVGLKETYKQLRGAVALVWWDKKKKSLNFIRNHHRPLVYAWTKEKDGIIWASEGWMIEVAAERNKIEYGKIFDTGVHKHYEMTFDKKKITIKKRKIKPFILPKYEGPFRTFGEKANLFDVLGKPKKTMLDGDYIPFGTDQNPSTSTNEDDYPMVGRSYSLYPRNIVKTYRKKAIESYTIICGFQNLHKKYVAKIQIFNKSDHYLADLFPSSDSLYNKLFYKGRISHSYHSGKKGDEKVFIIGVSSVEVIVPRDAKRKVSNGEQRMDRNMFDIHFKDCGFCGDPLCFEDDKIEFSKKVDDLAICGKCSQSFDMEEEGF